MYCVEINGLYKSYPGVGSNRIQVLDIAALTLRTGELTCVLGPTGCGKTTLMNILAGVDHDYGGEVRFSSSNEPRISYMFQSDLLLEWRTVSQNILLGLDAIGVPTTPEIASRWLDKIGLSSFTNAYPSTLSVGMRQRVALARTLAMDSDMILLDEPLSAQDFSARLRLEDLLREIMRQSETVAVIVTHNIEEAIILADRILVLSDRPAKIIADIELTEMPKVNRAWAGRRHPSFARYVIAITKALTSNEPGS